MSAELVSRATGSAIFNLPSICEFRGFEPLPKATRGSKNTRNEEHLKRLILLNNSEVIEVKVSVIRILKTLDVAKFSTDRDNGNESDAFFDRAKTTPVELRDFILLKHFNRLSQFSPFCGVQRAKQTPQTNCLTCSW